MFNFRGDIIENTLRSGDLERFEKVLEKYAPMYASDFTADGSEVVGQSLVLRLTVFFMFNFFFSYYFSSKLLPGEYTVAHASRYGFVSIAD